MGLFAATNHHHWQNCYNSLAGHLVFLRQKRRWTWNWTSLISVHSHQINAHGDTLTSATMESVSAWTKLYSSVADNSRDLSEIVSDILVHNAAEGGGRRKARGKKRSESATAETLKNRRAGLEIIHFYGNWEIKSSMCLHRKWKTWSWKSDLFRTALAQSSLRYFFAFNFSL